MPLPTSTTKELVFDVIQEQANAREHGPPRGVHDGEWRIALQEVRDGVEFPQQAAAHQAQLDQHAQPHWGSTSKAAWKDRFVSISLVFLLNKDKCTL